MPRIAFLQLKTSSGEVDMMTSALDSIISMARIRYERAFPPEAWDLFPLECARQAMQMSGDFDKEAYLDTYPDVAVAGIDPVVHYLTSGVQEGRHLALLPKRQELNETGNDRFNRQILSFFRAHASQQAKTTPAMLHEMDRAIYFYFASQYTQGDIIDAGCLVGGTTLALLDGLRQAGKTKIVRVFDQFSMEKYKSIQNFLIKHYGQPLKDKISFRTYFDENLKQYLHLLDVHACDLSTATDIQADPIFFLGLDCCKSVNLTDRVIRLFYDKLVPGKSVVINQDYIHEWLPHIHISMELLADYFKPIIEGKQGCCYGWIPIRAIQSTTITRIFGEYDSEGKEACSWYRDINRNLLLFDRAINRLLYPESKMRVGFAKAAYLRDMGKVDDAKNVYRKFKGLYSKFRIDGNFERYIYG